MSPLTDEQRRRIEENRQKALQKRAANSTYSSSIKSISANSNNTTQNVQSIPKLTLPSQNGTQKTNTFFQSTYPTNLINNNASSKSNISNGSKTISSTPNSFVNSTTFSGSSLSNVSNDKSEKPKVFTKFGDYTRGVCILLNRQRFFVDMSFHKETIEVFKQVPSRLYDTQTKRWNFAINDHNKLMSLLKPLQPGVMIIPLPRLILKIFSNAAEKRVFEESDFTKLDPVLKDALLPFQKEGVTFGVHHNGRVLIADDMGLGKTIQAIAIADYFREDWPLLVVVPSSVRYSWQESFQTWLPSVDPQEIAIINFGKDHIPNSKVILMSYDLLTKMQDSILNRNFKSVIFDESHFLKNPKSARTKAAQTVIKSVKRVIMLTGTPALSRPIELYTQISGLLKKGDFFTFNEYGMRYCNGRQMPWGMDFSGSSNMEELQLVLEELIMIRRMKSEVIKQLPAKFRQLIVLDPSLVSTKSKVLKALFLKMKQDNLKGMERRGALLEYFHETGEVKMKAVCEYVIDLLESDRKFICFAHHQNVMNGICNAIENKKISYIRIDGSVSSEQRKHLCDKFQLNDTYRVAVLSITAANCGLTLTAASLVVFAELFWNPGILTQAEDRAHRIGQENSVVVQYLVARGTADDEIWPLVQRKLDILNKAGLSKDNFRSADTVVKEDKMQAKLEDFWEELNESLEPKENVPEKKMRLDELF